MNNALQFVKIVSLLALAFLLGELGYTVHVARHGTAVQKVDNALDNLNTDLKETYKVTHDARVTLDSLNKAAIDERFYFEHQVPVVLADVHTVLQSTNTTVVGVGATTEHLNTTLDGLKGTEASASALLDATTYRIPAVLETTDRTMHDVDNLILDPAVTETLRNVSQTSTNIADGTAQAAQILKDGREVADRYVKPQTWYMKVLDYTLRGGMLVYDFIR